MVRMMNLVYSLALLATGFLGLTGLQPIFITYPVSANIGAIVLGIMGLLIMIFVQRSGETGFRKGNTPNKEKKMPN